MAIDNPDKYYLRLPNGEESVWSEKIYNKRRDQLFTDFPGVQVSVGQDYDGSDDIADDDSFVITAKDGSQSTWDGNTFRQRRDQLYADFPGVKVKRVRPVNFWKEKGDTQKNIISDRLNAIDEAERGVDAAAYKEFSEGEGKKSFGQKLADAARSASRSRFDPYGYGDNTNYRGWLNSTGRQKYGDDIRNYEAAKSTLRDAQELQGERQETSGRN